MFKIKPCPFCGCTQPSCHIKPYIADGVDRMNKSFRVQQVLVKLWNNHE